jgi:DNA-binding MurR/RpiR family transcriptional regulator
MFRERIRQAYNGLTPSFRRLGEFILNHELDAAFMTATELAQALDVDAATVVRFSQTIGYSGYRELSHEVQRIVKGDLTAAYASFPEAQTDAERLRALVENERHNMEMAIAQLTDKAAEVVELIARAGHVWVVGDATAAPLASLFADLLRTAGINAMALDANPATAAREALNWGANDLVIGLGVEGTGLDTAAVLRFAKEKGCEIVALSTSPVAPPVQVAERVIICPSSTPVGLTSVASLVTMLSAVWQAVLARDKAQMEGRVAQIRETTDRLVAARAG